MHPLRPREVFWALMIVIAGCADGPRSDGRVAVSGTVTLDGTAATAGQIAFRPQEGHDGPVAGGPIDESGHYAITADEGPATGPYSVRITIGKLSREESLRDGTVRVFEQTAIISDRSGEGLNFDLITPRRR